MKLIEDYGVLSLSELPTALEIQRLAQRRGVGVYPLPAGYAYGRPDHGRRTLILGYTAISEDLIRQGIWRVADAIAASAGRTIAG
jgi:DNA-binding transcriptional MocR family regulator